MKTVSGKYDVVVLTASERDGELARTLEAMSMAVFELALDEAAEVCFESWPKALAGDAAVMLERRPDGKCLLERLDESGCDSLRVLSGGDELDDAAREQVGHDQLVYAVVPGGDAVDVCRMVEKAVETVNESYARAAAFRRAFSDDSGFRSELNRRWHETASMTKVLTCHPT